MINPYNKPKSPLGPRLRLDLDLSDSADERSGWLFVGGNDEHGRKTTIDTIHDLLQKKSPHPIQLVGCFGIGKTATVEYAVLKENEKRVASETQYGIVVVSEDSLEENSVVDNNNRFFTNLFRAIGLSLNTSSAKDQSEECSQFPTSASLLESLKDEATRRRYKRLVIVLDSFEQAPDSIDNTNFKKELQDFINVITRLGWLLVIETRYHEELSYQIEEYNPTIARPDSKNPWPGDSNTEKDATKSQKIPLIPLRGLSRSHTWQLIWGVSRETILSYRTPYYLSKWRRWRQLWIPFLVQRYTGTHPLLLHTICYELDSTFRGLQLDRADVIEAIRNSFKSHCGMLNKLQKSISASVQDLSSGDSRVRRKAHKNLKQQGLLIKSWSGRSYLPETIRFHPVPPIDPARDQRSETIVTPIREDRREIERQYLSSTFAIWDRAFTEKIGTGFLISHNETIYGITCAHNIKAVFTDESREGSEFCVRLAIDNSELKVRIIHYKPGREEDSRQWAAIEDIAILSVESDVPIGNFFPLASPNTEHMRQGPNKFFGYFIPAGDWVSVSAFSKFTHVHSGMYKIPLEDFNGSTLKGASGAPLLNFQTQEYLGIIRAQQETETALWAYAIPSTKIHNVLQEICSNE